MLQTQEPCYVNPLAKHEYQVADLRVVKQEVPIQVDVEQFSKSQLDTRFVLTEQACAFHHQGFTYYACPICQLTFMLFSEVRMHSVIHLNDIIIPTGLSALSSHESNDSFRTANVEITGTQINQQGQILYPTRAAEPSEQAYQCEDNYSVETNTCGDMNTYPCLTCSKIFPTITKLQKHALVHIVGGKKHKCHICHEGFDAYNQLRYHRYTHLIEKQFKCNICDKAYKFKNNLTLHLKTHSSYSERKFKCDLCDYRGITNFRLEYHKEQNHKSVQSIDWVCEKCGQGFTTKQKLSSHIYSKHKETRLKCLECDKTLRDQRSLRSHMETHMKNRPKIHKCEVCGTSYYTKTHLEHHRNAKHLNIKSSKEYKCNICGKTVTTSSSLVVHIRGHTGEKPFSCNVCNKEFAAKRTLRIHQRIHTGEKPFSCDICGRSFSQKPALNIHKRIHAGLKPFACEMCPKCFVTKTLLKAHVKTHVKTNDLS